MKYVRSNGLEKAVPAVRPYVRREPREYLGIVGSQYRMLSMIPEWIAVLAEHFSSRELQRLLRRRSRVRENELRAAAEAGEIGFIREMWL